MTFGYPSQPESTQILLGSCMFGFHLGQAWVGQIHPTLLDAVASSSASCRIYIWTLNFWKTIVRLGPTQRVQMSDKGKDIASKVSNKAQDLTEKAKQTVQDAWGTAKETSQKIKDSVAGKADDTKEVVKENAETVKRCMNTKGKTSQWTNIPIPHSFHFFISPYCHHYYNYCLHLHFFFMFYGFCDVSNFFIWASWKWAALALIHFGFWCSICWLSFIHSIKSFASIFSYGFFDVYESFLFGFVIW